MNQLMKRVLSVLLVVCLLCSALPSAFAAEGGGFTDVSKDHWRMTPSRKPLPPVTSRA